MPTNDLVSVWDLEGNKHELTEQNAHDMVMHLKWTRRPWGLPEGSSGDISMDIPEIARRGSRHPEKLVEVYDKEGKTHLMSVANATDMVQHLGWSTSSIIPQAPVVVDVPRKKETSDEEKAPSPIDLDAIGDKISEPEEPAPKVDLSAMSRDELVKFAKKKYKMNFGPDVPQEEILDAIVAELG